MKLFSKKIIFFAIYPWHKSRLFYIWTRQRKKTTKQNADVAQLDRAFGYEPKGSRFESWHPQKRRLVARLAFSVFVSSQTGANVSQKRPVSTGRVGERTSLHFIIALKASPVFILLQVRVLAPAEKETWRKLSLFSFVLHEECAKIASTRRTGPRQQRKMRRECASTPLSSFRPPSRNRLFIQNF